VRARANQGDVEKMMRNTATQDGKQVKIGFGQDPGQAGKSQAQHLVRALSGFIVRSVTESGDKLTRFAAYSSRDHARFIIASSANLRRHRSSQANVYRFCPSSVLRRLSAALLPRSPPLTIA
jgi:phage terminase large subunit-like protein